MGDSSEGDGSSDADEPDADVTADASDVSSDTNDVALDSGDVAADSIDADLDSGDATDVAEDSRDAVVDVAPDSQDVSPDTDARCGDGTVALDEECDDGNRLSNDGCSADCRQEYVSARLSLTSHSGFWTGEDDLRYNATGGFTLFDSTCEDARATNLGLEAGGSAYTASADFSILSDVFAALTSTDDGQAQVRCNNGRAEAESCWIQIDFARPQLVVAMRLRGMADPTPVTAFYDTRLDVSVDGVSFDTLLTTTSEPTSPPWQPRTNRCWNVERCGDGVLDAAEACDQGTANSDSASDSCRTSCEMPSCGDGVVDAGEDCDGGPGCLPTCAVACGNGELDEGEQCDDGAGNSDVTPDACRTNCLLPICGDGTADTGEACDTGASNSDTVANACRSNCDQAQCGDGVVDDGEDCDGTPDCADACEFLCGNGTLDGEEECDEGAENSDVSPDACRSNCTLAACGDSVVDRGETCDDGNTTGRDGCSAECAAEPCGDGELGADEQCDDGNRASGDGCSSSCEREYRAVRLSLTSHAGFWTGEGDLEYNSIGGFSVFDGTCDDSGATNLGLEAGSDAYTASADNSILTEAFAALNASDDGDAQVRCNVGRAESRTCWVRIDFDAPRSVGAMRLRGMADPTPVTFFYDTLLDASVDGVTFNTVLSTTSEPTEPPWRPQTTACWDIVRCGDEVIDGGEGCDDGRENSDTRADACRTSCEPARCGDGVVDSDEECDGGFGCLPSCVLACGNGVLNPGEECDAGAANSDELADSCRTNCLLPTCGDGTADAGEECDDGNMRENDGCGPTCMIEDCYDGVLSPGEHGVDCGGECSACPTSCLDVLQAGNDTTGMYQLGGATGPWVWCEMEQAGGGWQLVLNAGTDQYNGAGGAERSFDYAGLILGVDGSLTDRCLPRVDGSSIPTALPDCPVGSGSWLSHAAATGNELLREYVHAEYGHTWMVAHYTAPVGPAGDHGFQSGRRSDFWGWAVEAEFYPTPGVRPPEANAGYSFDQSPGGPCQDLCEDIYRFCFGNGAVPCGSDLGPHDAMWYRSADIGNGNENGRFSSRTTEFRLYVRTVPDE